VHSLGLAEYSHVNKFPTNEFLNDQTLCLKVYTFLKKIKVNGISPEWLDLAIVFLHPVHVLCSTMGIPIWHQFLIVFLQSPELIIKLQYKYTKGN
jgi:hypothetical protein